MHRAIVKETVEKNTLKNEDPQNTSSSNDFTFLETSDFNIHFWSDIDNDNCAKLSKELRELDKKSKIHEIEYGVSPEITLYIKSYGGYVSSGFAVADTIRQIQTPVNTVIEGICASAGTLLSISGNHRKVSENTMILIHQFSGGFWGTYEQMKDEMKYVDALYEQMVSFYVKNTDMKRAKVVEILKHDYWMSPKEALELGVADEII